MESSALRPGTTASSAPSTRLRPTSATSAPASALEAAAQLAASGWLASRPFTAAVAPVVATAITGLVQGMHAVSRPGGGAATSRDAAGIDEWLRTVFGVPRATTSTIGVGGHIATSMLALMSPFPPPPPPPPGPPAPAPPPAPATPPLAPDPAPGPPTSWQPANVLRSLQELGGDGAAELETIHRRLAVATAVEEVGEALERQVRSDFETGLEVHRVLQGRWRQDHPVDEFVADRVVWGVPGAPLGLAEVAADPSRPYHYRALNIALLTTRWESRRRTDLTDFGAPWSPLAGGNWEIKAMLSAREAVVQEAWYRCAFNAWSKVLQEDPLFWGQPKLNPGNRWPNWLLGGIPLTPAADGRQRVALPFDLPELPGIVLYAVLLGLSANELATIVALLLFHFRKEIRRRLKELEQSPGPGPPPAPLPARDGLIELQNELDALAPIIAEGMLVLGAMLAIATSAQALWARLAQSLPAAAEVALFLEELELGAFPLFILLDPREVRVASPLFPRGVGAQPAERAAIEPITPRGTFAFGSCTVAMPTGRLEELLGGAQHALTGGLRGVAAALRQYAGGPPLVRRSS
jgi:hypothetical protein